MFLQLRTRYVVALCVVLQTKLGKSVAAVAVAEEALTPTPPQTSAFLMRVNHVARFVACSMEEVAVLDCTCLTQEQWVCTRQRLVARASEISVSQTVVPKTPAEWAQARDLVV